MSSFGSSNIQISYSQIDIVTYVTSCYRLTPRLTKCKHFLLPGKCILKGYIRCNLSAEFQRGLGWSRPLLSLMSKYCLMILLITLTYVTLSDLQNLMTTSRSISLYHRSHFKSLNNVRYPTAASLFHNFSLNFQTTFPLFDIVTHVTRCFRLTPQHRGCKHPLFDAA